MKRTLIILATLLSLAHPAAAQVWSPLGPAPISNASDTGRLSAIACHPTDASRYFVAGADGGVWRTTDGGASWSPLTDHLPTTAIGALALDPANPETIYAGTGEANFANHSRYGLGLYKSTDGGDTWSHLAQTTFAGRCFSRIIVHPTNPARLFAAVTTAGGFPALAAAKNHPSATGPVGVFRSTDGGNTWSHLVSGLPALSATDLLLDPATNTLFAAIGHIFGDPANGIYKGTINGNNISWTRLTTGLPTTGLGRISLAQSPSSPTRLYALITRAADASGGGASTLGLYRSDNAGDSWTLVNGTNIQATYGWYLSTLIVHPTLPDTLFCGGLSLVRSTNGGSTFTTVTPPHVDMHALAWDASGRLLSANDGGLHRSTNLGNNWTALNAGLATVQFYAGLSTHPTDDARILGGTQDNGTNLRSSESLIWTRILGGDGGWTQWDQSNPLILFSEFQGTGNIYRSTNGGASYTLSNTGIITTDRNCFLPPFLITPNDPSTLLYATDRIYRSTTGGTSWSPISPSLTPGAIRSLAISPADPLTVYAATNDSRILTSTDGGTSFSLSLTDSLGWPRSTRELTPHPTSPTTAYLAGATFSAPHIRRTTDRGLSWQTLDGTLPNIPVNVIAVDARCSPHTLFAGTDSGLLHSRDNGLTWSPFGAGLPNACIIDLLLQPERNRLIAATQGRGTWVVPLHHCPGDADCDQDTDSDDITRFFSAWDNADPAADTDADGDTDSDDIVAFFTSWDSGC